MVAVRLGGVVSCCPLMSIITKMKVCTNKLLLLLIPFNARARTVQVSIVSVIGNCPGDFIVGPIYIPSLLGIYMSYYIGSFPRKGT